jgi:hypothetical protein
MRQKGFIPLNYNANIAKIRVLQPKFPVNYGSAPKAVTFWSRLPSTSLRTAANKKAGKVTSPANFEIIFDYNTLRAVT